MDFAADMPLFWQVFFLAILPLGELRAAIPFGIAMGMEPLPCFMAACAGNLLPVLPLFLLLFPVCRTLQRLPVLQPFWLRLEKSMRNKGEKAERYGAWGLFLIVAVPLPLTGAWSGCFIARLFGIGCARAMLAIAGGVMAAGVLVMFASLGILQLTHFAYGMPLLLLAAAAAVIYFFRRKKKI